MNVVVLKEKGDEARVAVTPESVEKFSKLGLSVFIERGAGQQSFYSDEAYLQAGAHLIDQRSEALKGAQILLCVQVPEIVDLISLGEESLVVGLLDPLNNPTLLEALVDRKINAVSLEFLPRITLAQPMDVLSSQSNLAGYAAVVQGIQKLSRVVPLMMTAAGAVSPARVFVLGAGVAGLQAIATAKRLGARVEAYDSRAVVEEQVKSLGAKFMQLDLGPLPEGEKGYASALSEEQLIKQRQALEEICSYSDLVITTAKVFGKKAPILLSSETIQRMRPGAVVVDLAAESGGNIEGGPFGNEFVTENGVSILGYKCFENTVATHASQLYAQNLFAFVEHFWDKESKTFRYDLGEALLSETLICAGGQRRLKAGV